jgi:hypothetical protein
MAIVRSVAVCVFVNALTVAETLAGWCNVEDGMAEGEASHYKQYVIVDARLTARPTSACSRRRPMES